MLKWRSWVQLVNSGDMGGGVRVGKGRRGWGCRTGEGRWKAGSRVVDGAFMPRKRAWFVEIWGVDRAERKGCMMVRCCFLRSCASSFGDDGMGGVIIEVEGRKRLSSLRCRSASNIGCFSWFGKGKS